MGRGDVNMQLVAKPKLSHTLGFTMYTRFYFIISRADLLTRNEYPVPEVQHLLLLCC